MGGADGRGWWRGVAAGVGVVRGRKRCVKKKKKDPGGEGQTFLFVAPPAFAPLPDQRPTMRLRLPATALLLACCAARAAGQAFVQGPGGARAGRGRGEERRLKGPRTRARACRALVLFFFDRPASLTHPPTHSARLHPTPAHPANAGL